MKLKMTPIKRYKIFLSRTICLIWTFSFLFTVQIDARNKKARIDSIFIEKTFPVANFIRNDPQTCQVIQNDSILGHYQDQYYRRLKEKLMECEPLECFADAAKWSQDEVKGIGNRFVELCLKKREIRNFVSVYKKTGPYEVYESCNDTAFIRAVWEDMAQGLNHIQDIYVAGVQPIYSTIDGIIETHTTDWFSQSVRDSLSSLLSMETTPSLFFDLSVRFSFQILLINGRDEAVRYEPLNLGLNEAPCKSIRHVAWSSYPYSMILVPGHGPDNAGIAIDTITIKRCHMAVERYKDKLAPFIVVSGGHVHPNKTPFCEAVEMKKYLMDELNIADSVIFIEPHARHTTTNIRNVNRMIYRFNMPDTMKILTVTDSGQSSYLLRIKQRAFKELGYVPMGKIHKRSDNENEYFPVKEVLHPNPTDPLDP